MAPPRAVRPIRTKMTTSTVIRRSPRWTSLVSFVLTRLRGPVPRPRRPLPHLDALVGGIAAGCGCSHPPIGDLELRHVGERVLGEHVRDRKSTRLNSSHVRI